MKKLLFLCCLFALCAVFAKHDGWYVNQLTENYKTHCLEWDKSSPELNVLFILQPTGARDVIELKQRFNLKFTPFLAQGPAVVTSENVYRAALSGTGIFEKNEEIRAKAGKKYDVIFIGNAPFAKLPSDAQFQLLSKIQQGTGLVIHRNNLPYKKLFANPIALPDFVDEVALPFDRKYIKAYQFGKGRVLVINNSHPGAPAMTRTYGETDQRASARFENELVFLYRAMQWASNRDVSCGKFADKGTYLAVHKDAEYRLRDEFNNVIDSGEVRRGKINLPILAGKYFCDIILRGKACAVFAFERSAVCGKSQIRVSSEYMRGKIPFKGTFTMEKAAAVPASLTLTLVDSPDKRVWEKKVFAIPAGVKKVDFEFKNYRMPNEAGVLYAVVTDKKGSVLGKADKMLYFPADKLPDYYQASFGAASGINMANQLVNNMGFGAALTHLNYNSIRRLAQLNIQAIPYLVRINFTKGPKDTVKMQFLTSHESKLANKIGDMSFYNPEIKKLWTAQVNKRLNGLTELSPVLYSLGDENGLNRTGGFGASDLPAFRKFVEKKYGTIAKLNENWGSNYKSFAEVPHRPLAVSLKEKRFAEWNDHNEYMERMFADTHHYTAKLIKAQDPHAKVGLEGTFGGHDMELMMESLDWWGPYSNMLEDQILRSLYPEVPRFVWSGYHGERNMKAPLMNRYLLLGSVNGNGWYATQTDFNHDILAVDQSPSYSRSFNDSLQHLRLGMAQTLINNPMFDSKVGIYWSHVSRRAPKVDERCFSPDVSIAPLIRFCNNAGVGYEFVTARTAAKRLPKMKILFMLGINAMSDKEAAMILDFVKNGGTVISDFPPARLNENLAVRKSNPLAALFDHAVLTPNGKYDIRPLRIPGFMADKAVMNLRALFMHTKYYGKGKAINANFNFAFAESFAHPNFPFYDFMYRTLKENGAVMPYSQSNREALFRVRSGKGFELLGVYNNKNSLTDIKLPQKGYIYECGKGYVGFDDGVTVNFTEEKPLRVYAVFDKMQGLPYVKAPETVAPGGNIVFEYDDIPAGRTVVIRVTTPDGKEALGRAVVTNTDNGKKYSFGIPYNAPKADYKFTITDYETGLSVNKTVRVE